MVRSRLPAGSPLLNFPARLRRLPMQTLEAKSNGQQRSNGMRRRANTAAIYQDLRRTGPRMGGSPRRLKRRGRAMQTHQSSDRRGGRGDPSEVLTRLIRSATSNGRRPALEKRAPLRLARLKESAVRTCAGLPSGQGEGLAVNRQRPGLRALQRSLTQHDGTRDVKASAPAKLIDQGRAV